MIRVMDAIVPHVGAGQEWTSVGLDCARVIHTGGLGEQDEFCGLRGDPEKAVRRDREPFRTPVPSAPDPRDGPSRGRHSGGGRPRGWVLFHEPAAADLPRTRLRGPSHDSATAGPPARPRAGVLFTTTTRRSAASRPREPASSPVRSPPGRRPTRDRRAATTPASQGGPVTLRPSPGTRPSRRPAGGRSRPAAPGTPPARDPPPAAWPPPRGPWR